MTPLAPLIDDIRTSLPLPARPLAIASLRLETADTNEGKELSGLCRALEKPLAAQVGLSDDPMAIASGYALHVLFVDGAHVYVGASRPPWGSRWPMGIPRLRMPAGAPSRSTLKLVEAFVTFLGDRELELAHAGMRAIDLGAAPGGWTWQLAHRGLRVTAVDNGLLKGEVAHDPLVTHLRADGLTYVPRRPVDWLVCDIAEQPSRIAGARRPLDRRGLRETRDLQPQAADEEALRRGAALHGDHPRDAAGKRASPTRSRCASSITTARKSRASSRDSAKRGSSTCPHADFGLGAMARHEYSR